MLETRRYPLDKGTRRGVGGVRLVGLESLEKLENLESLEKLERLENIERLGLERPTGKTTIERINRKNR